MPNTRPNIPLNDCVLSTLRAGVEVRSKPPGVHTCHHLVLLIHGNVEGGGVKADSLSDGVPPPDGRHLPTNRSDIGGKTKDHGDVLQRHHGLATRKVERVGLQTPPVHKCVNVAESNNGRPWVVTSRASGRNPARHMNVTYRSSHVRVLCMCFLSSCKCCET
jgi:hypothetical protein